MSVTLLRSIEWQNNFSLLFPTANLTSSALSCLPFNRVLRSKFSLPSSINCGVTPPTLSCPQICSSRWTASAARWLYSRRSCIWFAMCATPLHCWSRRRASKPAWAQPSSPRTPELVRACPTNKINKDTGSWPVVLVCICIRVVEMLLSVKAQSLQRVRKPKMFARRKFTVGINAS